VTFGFTRYVEVIDTQTLKLVNTINVVKSPHGIFAITTYCWYGGIHAGG